MTYDAVLENLQSGDVQVSILGWPHCRVTGANRQEALKRLRDAIRERFAKVEVVPIEVDVPQRAHAWGKYAGMFKDDPVFEEVLEEIEAYRHEIDSDDSTL